MGAKFSSGGGASVFYDGGPITAPSGEQGTQRNEFQAKIASVTSSTTIGAVFLYDTSQDSDGGKWRKKCKGLSWYDEASSATRSARSEFPAMALIVADNVSSGTSTVTIYDLDDVAATLWMQFSQGGSYPSAVMLGRTAPDITSVYMLNGRLCVGIDNSGYGEALAVINFPEDSGIMYSTASWGFGQNIANRNTSTTVNEGTSAGDIVNITVNDVSATVLEGAEIGALGLPIPTVAVATEGGVSVIHANGDVYNIQSSSASYRISDEIQIDKHYVYFPVDSSTTNARTLQVHRIPYAAVDPVTSSDSVTDKYATSSNAAASVMPRYLGSNTLRLAKYDGGFAVGTTSGLSIFKDNEGNREESAVSHILGNYNTGYMVGDIRLATATCSASALSGGTFDDRSVKGNDLNVTGTLQRTAVATGAEQTALSDFSASTNYLGQNAHKTDWDFGTGDFSIMCWVKWTANGTSSQYIIDRGSAGAERFYLYDASSGGKPVFYVTDDASGGGSDSSITTTNDYDDGNWHQIVAVRRSSKLSIYVDGVDAQTTHVSSSQDLDNSSGYLRVGVSYVNDLPFNGSLALLRLSATAPTAQQIKTIFDEEKVLFQANAKCTLAANQVNDLAYDKTSGLLHVASESTASSKSIRGLEVVESLTSDGSLALTASTAIDGITAAGGVLAGYDSAKVGVNLPALDVRAELNEGESKLPDDGKLHFSGVTTDATPTVIAYIPMELYSTADLVIKGTMQHYQTADSGHWGNYQIRQRFYRQTSGAIARAAASKLVDEGTSTLDVTTSTSGNYITVSVTGAAGARLVWNASVEVQRISEKRYER